MIVGVIADTHGLLRPEAVAALRGSELILHAGDVGKPEILDELRALAPVVAVRGNVDTAVWATALRLAETVDAGGAPHRPGRTCCFSLAAISCGCSPPAGWG